SRDTSRPRSKAARMARTVTSAPVSTTPAVSSSTVIITLIIEVHPRWRHSLQSAVAVGVPAHGTCVSIFRGPAWPRVIVHPPRPRCHSPKPRCGLTGPAIRSGEGRGLNLDALQAIALAVAGERSEEGVLSRIVE